MLRGRRRDPAYCIRCPGKVADLRCDIETLAFAALDEEMPWQASDSEADT